ncbi:Homeobox associated leucine zipper [compost metagenome]
MNRQQIRKDYDAARTDYDETRMDYDAIRTDYDTIRTDYDTIRTDYDAIRTDYDAIRTDYDAARTDYDAIRTDYDAIRKNYDTIRAKYEPDRTMPTHNSGMSEHSRINYLQPAVVRSAVKGQHCITSLLKAAFNSREYRKKRHFSPPKTAIFRILAYFLQSMFHYVQPVFIPY